MSALDLTAVRAGGGLLSAANANRGVIANSAAVTGLQNGTGIGGSMMAETMWTLCPPQRQRLVFPIILDGDCF
jgi:hypothetical protein